MTIEFDDLPYSSKFKYDSSVCSVPGKIGSVLAVNDR